MKKTEEKGIARIALVVIILLIIVLGGVGVYLVLGNNRMIDENKEVSQNVEGITQPNLETSKKITASNIEADASYIGKYVNYGGQETYKEVKWRIFNAENGQIQLIADNYIKSDVMPTAENIKKGTAVGAHTGEYVRAEDNRITLLNYINTTSNWSDFIAVTGATVTGAPTIEQFVNSYNRTHGASSNEVVKEIFIAKSEKMNDGLEGYYVGTIKNPTTLDMDGLNTTEMENLYVIDGINKGEAYWLGSPSASNSAVLAIGGSGYVYGEFDYGAIGLRPLVLLPSGITLVEQENGTYNVQ